MGGCIILPKLSGVFCVIFQVFSLSSPFIWANEYLTRNYFIIRDFWGSSPQRANFHALDIQLWCLSMAAAGVGTDLLQLEVPPWSTRHPAGLLQGTQAQPFCFCRRFQKILLPYWCGIEQTGGEMKCCPGVSVSQSWHQGVLGIIHFVVHVPGKAEMLLNMVLSHTDGVKAICHLLRSSVSNDISLHSLPVFSQSYFSYWRLDSGFPFGTKKCCLVCSELCYLLGVSPGKKQITPGI